MTLMACTVTPRERYEENKPKQLSISDESYLEDGKRHFEEGFYKTAMQELLPVAVDGSAQAQYAVGYMYYYGYGVAQDTDVGFFWIQRAAGQHYPPAMQALHYINSKRTHRKNPM
jgi:TPR repeat protein